VLPALPALAVVYAISVVRLRIWRIAPGQRRVTIGMLAMAIASTLFLPFVGERIIDPRNLLGANLSDLGQHLAALLGCYELSAAAIECARGERWPIRYLRLAAVIFVLTSLLASFVIVLLVSLETMILGPQRLTMILMYCLATIAIGRSGTIAVLLVVAPDWVRSQYHEWVMNWSVVGHSVLAIVGIAGLRDAWMRRQEPRR
jgi:hypothetical protein